MKITKRKTERLAVVTIIVLICLFSHLLKRVNSMSKDKNTFNVSPNKLFVPLAFSKDGMKAVFNINRGGFSPFSELPTALIDGYNPAIGGPIVGYAFNEFSEVHSSEWSNEFVDSFEIDYKSQYDNFVNWLRTEKMVWKFRVDDSGKDIKVTSEQLADFFEKKWKGQNNQWIKPDYIVRSGQHRTTAMPMVLFLIEYLRENPRVDSEGKELPIETDADSYTVQFLKQSLEGLTLDEICIEMIVDNGNTVGKQEYSDSDRTRNFAFYRSQDVENKLSDRQIGEKSQFVRKNAKEGKFVLQKGLVERAAALSQCHKLFPELDCLNRLRDGVDAKLKANGESFLINIQRVQKDELKMIVGKAGEKAEPTPRLKAFLSEVGFEYDSGESVDAHQMARVNEIAINGKLYRNDVLPKDVIQKYFEYVTYGTIGGNTVELEANANAATRKQMETLLENNTRNGVFIDGHQLMKALVNGRLDVAREVLSDGIATDGLTAKEINSMIAANATNV